MGWFFIFLIVFFIFLLWPLNIVVDFKRKESNELEISLTGMKGLINHKINRNKIKKISEYNDKEILKVKKHFKYFKKHKKIMRYLGKNIKKIYWITNIGFEDAALTGISTGLLWSIKSSILSVFISKNGLDEIDINIYPDFNKSKFEIEFNCIIKCNLVYIIIIALYIGYKKGGE